MNTYSRGTGRALEFRLNIGNTNKEIIQWIAKTFKMQCYLSHITKGGKEFWVAHVDSKERILGFLKMLSPYLKIKKKIAEKVIELLEIYSGHKGREYIPTNKEEELYREIRQLNSR
jgi:hypothetical protein